LLDKQKAIFFFFFGGGGGGVSTNSVEDRGQRVWGSGDISALVRGSGGNCNLVQEISFHMEATVIWYKKFHFI